MLLDKTVFVSKINTDGPGTDKSTYTTFSGFLENGIPSAAVKMNIQTATPDMTMLADGEFNKTYTGFTLASGLVEGMRVTVSGTNDTYTVKGRDKLDYGPMVPHFEVTLIKEGR